MEGDLTAAAASLADLCRILGIDIPALAEVESAGALAHTFPVRAGDAARLDPAHVRAFVDHWGDAARVEIRTEDLTELVVDASVRDDDVSSFSQTAASGGPYEAVVTVDKARLIGGIAGPSPARTVRVFLFAAALRHALAHGLSRFETEVWGEAPAPLVIAVLDTDISLNGPHLTIVGGVSLHEASAAAGLPLAAIDFAPIIESRDRYIGWDSAWVRALTPWHFELSGTCADSELHGLLRAELVKLAVLFTCDRARIRSTPTPPGEILAEYRGREHVAVIPIDERAPLDCTDKEVEAVLRAVDWCYERHGGQGQPDWVGDRLPFVQTRVAQSLESHPAEDRFVIFARAMPYLQEGIEWHWKAFIEGKVSEYLDRVQQVETVVSDTVAAFADRTAALAKGLTETILAAIAVLIGSFIAAAFDTPFNATLFRIGVLTYAAYVVLFPGVIGLVASVSNLRSARAEFDTRVSRFDETLYPEKVTEIVGDRVTDAESSYYRWLAVVAIMYVAVAIAACVAALIVPHHISGSSGSHKTSLRTPRQALAAEAMVFRLGPDVHLCSKPHTGEVCLRG